MPFLGKLVEIRRPARHHAAVVGTDVPHADVVAHDDENVGLLACACASGGRSQDHRGGETRDCN
jgi:hypothetical protein